jgi:NAD(P)-dependent dehydrogenase (short-subunit alcohol dehydrogenase family)
MKSPYRLEGRVAIVTGGGSGIGQAISKRLTEEGASVVVVDRYADKARETAEILGSVAHPVQADVTSEADVERAVGIAVERFGRLDIGVNAAGIGLTVPLLDQTLEQWRQVMEINLAGVFVSCKYEARQMIRQSEGGVIINITSVNAVQPGEGISAYCASKAGVAILTRVAAMELAKHGIRVVAVGPGLTETPLTLRLRSMPAALGQFLDNIPTGRMGQPYDIAAAVAFLASDDAAYVTGSTMYVDGGFLTQRYPTIGSRTTASAKESK